MGILAMTAHAVSAANVASGALHNQIGMTTLSAATARPGITTEVTLTASGRNGMTANGATYLGKAVHEEVAVDGVTEAGAMIARARKAAARERAKSKSLCALSVRFAALLSRRLYSFCKDVACARLQAPSPMPVPLEGRGSEGPREGLGAYGS